MVHAVHPGAVPTRGAAAAEAHTGAAGSCLSALGGRFHRTVAQGAASIVFAAASSQLASGRGAFVCNANRADGHASGAAGDEPGGVADVGGALPGALAASGASGLTSAVSRTRASAAAAAHYRTNYAGTMSPKGR